jgi:hypothetical protein
MANRDLAIGTFAGGFEALLSGEGVSSEFPGFNFGHHTPAASVSFIS